MIISSVIGCQGGPENKSIWFYKLRTASYSKKRTEEEQESLGALQCMVLEKSYNLPPSR